MKKDLIWNTLGFGLYCFTFSILLVLVTRISGLETAGVFSVLYATANIISNVALYGGKTYHVTDKRGKKYNGTYLTARLCSALLSILVVIILSLFFNYDTSTTIIFFALCLTKIVDAISDSYHGILQINSKLYVVGISLLLKSLTSILVFGIILYLSNSLLCASISLVLVAILFFITFDYITTSKVFDIKYELDKTKFKQIVKECFFLFCGNIILAYLVNIPKYILVDFATESEQGIFAILIMPAFVVSTLSSFLIQPFLVDLTESFENDKKLYKKKVLAICKLIFLIFMVVLVVGYLIGLPVMSFIFGENLNSYKIELVITIVSSLLYTLSSFLIINLTLLRKVSSLLYLNIITAIIGGILTYFTISSLGLFGSYIGFFLIVLIQLILFTIYYIYELRKECE